MGMGAGNTLERVAASMGELDEVGIAFQPALDVPHGGVLLALPALLVSGLLCHTPAILILACCDGQGSAWVVISRVARGRGNRCELVA